MRWSMRGFDSILANVKGMCLIRFPLQLDFHEHWGSSSSKSARGCCRPLPANLHTQEQCAACAHFTSLATWGKQGLIAPAGICGMYKNRYKYRGGCGIKLGTFKQYVFQGCGMIACKYGSTFPGSGPDGTQRMQNQELKCTYAKAAP
eukprot:221231-Pelagomonas_calceolata.AAC.3